MHILLVILLSLGVASSATGQTLQADMQELEQILANLNEIRTERRKLLDEVTTVGQRVPVIEELIKLIELSYLENNRSSIDADVDGTVIKSLVAEATSYLSRLAENNRRNAVLMTRQDQLLARAAEIRARY